jgi:hypothetical protein
LELFERHPLVECHERRVGNVRVQALLVGREPPKRRVELVLVPLFRGISLPQASGAVVGDKGQYERLVALA